MIRFYFDENVPEAITKGLRLLGIDVVTVRDDGRNGEPDELILQRANQLGRVLFTLDDDLIKIAVQLQRQGHPFTGVVYVHQQILSDGECIRELAFLAQAGVATDFLNQVRYLPL